MLDKKDIEKKLKDLALEYAIYHGDKIEITIYVKKSANNAVLDCRIIGL